MKILFYCQHVLGMGHFFRTLEIVKALDKHQVILVSGGPPVDVALPAHVKEVRLPGLAMDENFSKLYSTDSSRDLDDVKNQRLEMLVGLLKKEKPDVFLIELYPFGRKAFGFELKPVLEQIRAGNLPPCKVVCSLRDILVEKKDPVAYEARVTGILNEFFHGVAVHSDPEIVSLDDTFSSLDQISVPIRYTGFVSPKSPPGAREKIRGRLGLGPEQKLIVGSAGGGKVGYPLLLPMVQAFASQAPSHWFLQVFTGPFLDKESILNLESFQQENLRVEKFTDHFLSWLAAADLSVSMAGYNTCMNFLAARVHALVWPFNQNREQLMRARRLEDLKALRILNNLDLEPENLFEAISEMLSKEPYGPLPVNLDGALDTAAWVETFVDQEGNR